MRDRKMSVEDLPVRMLPDVLLFATAARGYYKVEIVDDYERLRSRVEEEWNKEGYSAQKFDQLHKGWCGSVVNGSRNDFDEADVAYIPGLVKWYLDHSIPDYFEREEA